MPSQAPQKVALSEDDRKRRVQLASFFESQEWKGSPIQIKDRIGLDAKIKELGVWDIGGKVVITTESSS